MLAAKADEQIARLHQTRVDNNARRPTDR
jgi:hypothetical protein